MVKNDQVSSAKCMAMFVESQLNVANCNVMQDYNLDKVHNNSCTVTVGILILVKVVMKV